MLYNADDIAQLDEKTRILGYIVNTNKELYKKIANKYKDKFSNDNDFTNLIDKLLEEYFIREEQTL